ncbi:MAG: hypothetical protein CME30_02970 [Gemmatimonadetes bacterium]|nr:hypothetical protein [Gemmatimonadota bacterium]
MNVGRRFCAVYRLVTAYAILHSTPTFLIAQIPDTISLSGDTLNIEIQIVDSDSLLPSSDSVTEVVNILPQIPDLFTPSFQAGIWHWNREAMLSSNALTLAELVELTPGIVSLRGGDYGTPQTAVSFGLASGNIKIYWDGIEWIPLDTGVPDLSRVTLTGIKEVRIERRMTGLKIELFNLDPTESIPETVIQVGTGDLRTNFLRAELIHPDVLGGSLTFALDRIETRGPDFQNRGSLGGVGIRYALHKGDKAGLVLELKSSSPENDNVDFVKKINRSDWNVRGRLRLLEGLVGEAFVSSSSLSEDLGDLDGEGRHLSGRQLGLRTSYEFGGLWAEGDASIFSGSRLQEKTYNFKVGASREKLLTAEASFRGDYWLDRKVSSFGIHAVTFPLLGISLFGSYEDGTVGSPFLGETEGSQVMGGGLQGFTKRKGSRFGANFSWNGVDVSAASLSFEADSLRPLGLALEQRAVSLEGGVQNGFEVGITLPLPIPGFGVSGSSQIWQEESSYLPKRIWEGALTYHGVFKESENLEIWGKAGMIGRDSMFLRTLELNSNQLTKVASLERWFAYMQVRIVTVNIFVRWENMRGKIDNYDFPNRKQPRFRTMYGIRWILKN